jgi:dTDP-4-dehydrorhamnose 3,5-epimerase
MRFERLEINDIVMVDPRVHGDARGFFLESWQERSFAKAGIDAKFVQDNHSHSVRNTLRGLHYQLLRPQGKLVRVVHGEVFDVAVDVRRQSPTFGKWIGKALSAENHRALWIPPGFAHGFLVLSESADLLYKVTDYYNPGDEVCLRWNDPQIGVDWPLPAGDVPLLSQKDAEGGLLAEVEVFA